MIVYIKIFFVKFLLNSLVDHKMRRTILQKINIIVFYCFVIWRTETKNLH